MDLLYKLNVSDNVNLIKKARKPEVYWYSIYIVSNAFD